MKRFSLIFLIVVFTVSSIVIPLLFIALQSIRLSQFHESQEISPLVYTNTENVCNDAQSIDLYVVSANRSILFIGKGIGILIIGIGLNVFSDYFQPVESKIELKQETRGKIYGLISNEEGIHLREICRRLDKRMGVIQYHIYVLERAGIIKSQKDGRYRRFFLNGHEDGTERTAIVSLLKRPTTCKIIVYILEKQEISHAELAQLLGISSQAITWHIKKIQRQELIFSEKQGKQKIYHLNPMYESLIQELLNGND